MLKNKFILVLKNRLINILGGYTQEQLDLNLSDKLCIKQKEINYSSELKKIAEIKFEEIITVQENKQDKEYQNYLIKRYIKKELFPVVEYIDIDEIIVKQNSK